MTISPAAGVLPIIAMLTLTGSMINGVQTTMYALAAHVYPSSVRATGVGTAVAFGRTGAVLTRLRRQLGDRLPRHRVVLRRDRAGDGLDVRRAGAGPPARGKARIGRSAQPCEPQLVRTFATDREDNFVARRHVHRHLKIALERADQAVHRHPAPINIDRRQFAPPGRSCGAERKAAYRRLTRQAP